MIFDDDDPDAKLQTPSRPLKAFSHNVQNSLQKRFFGKKMQTFKFKSFKVIQKWKI